MSRSINPSQNFIDHFNQFERDLNGESNSAIHKLRRSAIETFKSSSFPTIREEEWRFTNLSPVEKIIFEHRLSADVPNISKPDITNLINIKNYSAQLIFINGIYSSRLSEFKLPDGIIIKSLKEFAETNSSSVINQLQKFTKDSDKYFTILNRAFLDQGIYIQLQDDIILDEPIHIIYLNTDAKNPFIVHPRNLIIIGKNSKVKIVEHYISINDCEYLTNTVSNIYLEERSELEHIKIQAESEKSYHIGSIEFIQETCSKLNQHTINWGGLISRNELISIMNGEHVECTFNGLSISKDNQLIDNHTTIDHAKPNCESHELYKSILDEKSRGVFNGKIFVRKDAQKTDAKQTNRTLLLSDETTMDTKPQLEIFADDVKCTHGAAIGYLDSEAIFYLRSRGIDEDEARDILTHAFANDVIDRISLEEFRNYLNDIVNRRIQKNK